MEGFETAAAYLRRGVSVEIVGRPASGRSEFLDRTANLLEGQGVHIRRIHGIGGWRDRAFGALAASLPELGRQPSIGEAVGLLERELLPKAVLVVDDADDLDDVSAGILAALRIRSPLPMLLSRRVGPRPSAPLRRLFASLVPVVRHTLRPLRYCELQDVVETELGGAVDGATMARIATKSGGLPGVARDLARVGKQTGRLTRLDGRWVASDRLWTSELGSSVDALLVDASPEDVDALTTLAVAGPVGVVDLPRLVPPAQVERLGALGLVELIDGPGRGGTVGLFPPLVEEYLARECSTSKRYAIRELLLAEGIPLPPGLVSERHRSLPVDNAILSRSVAERWAATLEQRLEQWRSRPVPANGVALLAALLTSQRAAIDPAVVFGNTEVSQDQATGAELAGWYAVHLAVGCRDWQEANHVLRQAAARYPDFDGYLQAVRQHLQLVVDRVPEHVEPAGPDAPAIARDGATGVMVEASIARGRPAQALAEVNNHQAVLPMFQQHGDVCHGLALVLQGEITSGTSWASARLDAAQREYNPGAIQGHGYVTALGLAIRGDLTRLDELVSHILTITSVSTLHAPYHEGVVGLAAARSRWFGVRPGGPEVAAAPSAWSPTSSASSASASPPPSPQGGYGPFPFMDLRVDPSGRGGATGAALWDMACSSADRGYAAAAIFATVEAAELMADPERFATVKATLDGVDSPFLLALVDLADGMVHRDVATLNRAQERLERFGAWLYVARAGIARVLALREQGDTLEAARQADRVWTLVSGAATGAEGLFVRLAHSMELSAREIEVATLLVDGCVSADIAKDLVLSVRTVENHIFNTYRKIGVESREGLRRAFSTWLRSALRLGGDAGVGRPVR